MFSPKSLALGGALAAALLLSATQALAHAHLVSSTPAANATVAAPKAITLTFNEKLEPKFSGFELAMADGMAVAIKTSVSQNRLAIVGTPSQPLAPGAYKVTWRAVAGDAHRMQGVVTFTVR